MDKKIKTLIVKYSDNEASLIQLVVTSFIRFNHLELDNGFLATFMDSANEELEADIELLSTQCTIEDVISFFELAIPDTEKTTNGSVYTPKYIRDYIVCQIIHSVEKPLTECLCADISCGCGAFLYTLAEYIHKHTGELYSNIFKHLYGVDISATSVNRAKIMLALVALQNGEIIQENAFNLFAGDSLTFDFQSMPNVVNNNGLDIIVGNPPYVRSRHINKETKKNLSIWSTSKVGNADLYIPFFEIGLTALNENGLLGYITVNTFFKSVNARTLRNYFSNNHLSLSIVDFGQQLVFKKKLAYTCLTFMSKKQSESLLYVKADVAEVEAQKNFVYSRIIYSSLDNHRGWHLNRNEVLENIRLIENVGDALGDKYVIKNGIATLANDVFIFRPVRTDGNYYYLLREGKEYNIEKSICRDIIKPNILKCEAEISEKEEKIISPYDADCNIIAEDFFVEEFPNAYKYLQDCRDVLDKRDNGEGDYAAWYAFGRTQAIADSGKKLLFPYMSDFPHFIYTSQKDMMIYCGYAIYNESETELLFLKKVLESSVFDYYIKNTSKPYSTGYYSYAKNYVKSFGIYPFTEEQKQHILSLRTKEEVNEYIRTVYQIAI
ncbi:MAG: SAM-dependent methyltransferase [Bacteroidales bacterium]|nr:SAM-dependent methyltransferase [Bacteroidales bacterium]